MQKTTITCDVCGNKVEGEQEADLSASLISIDSPEETRDIELEDLCVGCSDALLVAIKEVLLRRQTL